MVLIHDAASVRDGVGKTSNSSRAHSLRRNAQTPPNHHYRTLANLGTFYAQRWIKNRLVNPEAPVDFADLQKAESLIAQAIKENPDAHFGREKYQLLAIVSMMVMLILYGLTSLGYLGPIRYRSNQ